MDIVAPITEFWTNVTTLWGFTNIACSGLLLPGLKWFCGVFVGLMVMERLVEVV